MNFVIVAHDGRDEGALKRRLSCRAEHMAGIKAGKADGTIVDGGAMLDDADRMVGSVVLCEFPDRAALDEYLGREVYVTQGVWADITVHKIRRIDWASLMSD
ncbi:YciI family protein [Phenylobacterium sp.]|jgi:uncharacterized protein YciI|uniref:YciI family protein n=1 Tax=Phenylobacterium sp. TaxID=1871053 RepID=UPI0037CC6856